MKKILRYKDIKITPYLLLLYKYAYIYMFEKKLDPTNRIRTSDLRNSINNYSPPLYQLSYGRCPFYSYFVSYYTVTPEDIK